MTIVHPDSAPLADVLRRYWGYNSFLPLQEEAMRCVLAG
jgi:superfamily II DNA helicase RecQ